jgi:2-polyprenyl-6-methoxyphenol hydroxylase-like FAD-dependent oxidoreductase
LAGLTLGIGLRQRDIPVTICEAGSYPRHRVCGEFISGRGPEILEQLGLRELFLRAGARLAETAAFFSTTNSFPLRRLPSPALCLSRHAMDQLLADRFQQSGGELKANTRWQPSDFGEGVVRANGRQLRPVDHGWRWFGLKAHAANVHLSADLEMHVSRNSYVGLCRLGNGKVNVCGLFRRRTNETSDSRNWQELLRGPTDSLLRERLGRSSFDEASFCSVAGLCLRPQLARARMDCCIGDAQTMIPPVTGNGMSMAFESAQMAIEPLAAFSHGEVSWNEAQQTIAVRCDAAFAGRLRWARILPWLMFTPLLQTGAGSALLRSEWFWRMMFTRTR